MSVLRQRILLPYVPLHEDKSASGPRKEGIQPAASSPIKSAEGRYTSPRLRHQSSPRKEGIQACGFVTDTSQVGYMDNVLLCASKL